MALQIHSPLRTHDESTSGRRYARALFSVPITLHRLREGSIRTTRGITLDIAEGGLGALVQGDLHSGETVSIDLRLSDHPLSTVAIVRYSSDVRTGFEFLGLTAEERLQIANVVGQS
jgi:c-di-GMP-binding flagellar brake protein YcgR